MLFNSNKERRAFWEEMHKKYSAAQINAALETLKPDSVKVLLLHYSDGHGLPQIAVLMQRSVTVIRDHHNRGIYKLHKYFEARK